MCTQVEVKCKIKGKTKFTICSTFINTFKANICLIGCRKVGQKEAVLLIKYLFKHDINTFIFFKLTTVYIGSQPN